MEELDNEILLNGIPAEIANLELPDPYLRQKYLDDQNRIYWVDSEIDESTLDLVKFIMRCNQEDVGKSMEERKRILIMIDSPGGDVTVLSSIVGAIKLSKTPVYTCCYCCAMSAAADLLACGHKRFALPMTGMMFHMGSCMYSGSQNDVDKAKKFFDGIAKRIYDEVVAKTKFDNKFLKKLKTDDMYMNELEALQYGVIDKIIEDFEELM